MSDLLTYSYSDSIATIVMDDGKANAMSIDMLSQLHDAFDQAEQKKAVIVLSGKKGIFSSGFDLKVFAQGAENVCKMLNLGATLAYRTMAFSRPIVTACGGHCLPMGAFIMLCADTRVGTEGDFKIGFNEVEIGLTIPQFGIEIARSRLTPNDFFRSTTSSYMYSPQEAVPAGFLDVVTNADKVMDTAYQFANSHLKLDANAYLGTKLKTREVALQKLSDAIETELTLENTKIAMGEA